MIKFGHREGPQIGIGRSIFHNPFVVELAAMRRALQPGAKYLKLRSLMRTPHQQCRIFGFAKTVDTNRIF